MHIPTYIYIDQLIAFITEVNVLLVSIDISHKQTTFQFSSKVPYALKFLWHATFLVIADD